MISISCREIESQIDSAYILSVETIWKEDILLRICWVLMCAVLVLRRVRLRPARDQRKDFATAVDGEARERVNMVTDADVDLLERTVTV
jgi:hypothetical protein